MFQLQARAQAEIEIKKSRFIGIVQPVSSREEALARLAEIRAQWPDARHYCAVLLCGADSMLDDDGEPSGTAARPMYNVLRHKDVCDVLAVVVRYFGGIKLGAGGLVRAYTQAVNAAMDMASLTAVVARGDYAATVDFAGEARLRHLCQELGVPVSTPVYGERVSLTLSLPLAEAEALLAALTDGMAGALEVSPVD